MPREGHEEEEMSDGEVPSLRQRDNSLPGSSSTLTGRNLEGGEGNSPSFPHTVAHFISHFVAGLYVIFVKCLNTCIVSDVIIPTCIVSDVIVPTCIVSDVIVPTCIVSDVIVPTCIVIDLVPYSKIDQFSRGVTTRGVPGARGVHPRRGPRQDQTSDSRLDLASRGEALLTLQEHHHDITLGFAINGENILMDLQLNRQLLPQGYFEKQLYRNGSHSIRRPQGQDSNE
ncbi:hypothetical protein HAZT_HAZT000417 [Hyalella azteca]|uniref:Uncharacterized protein n=1 Tax=Hyalella azteca TaxID=294128 RepID=A0A6A0H999_HYAAZ|nr:hypothetical protein HAZT_HAZT000417 [Hyalella azteca]